MSKLVAELKEEHALIADVLQKVSALGITTPAGQKMLLDAKSGLLAHLKKEDTKLYPKLNAAAENDEALKRTLDLFAKDMDTMSKVVLNLFDKYANGGSGVEFARDFGSLYAKLSQRISKEENIIYAKYDELEKN